MGKQEWGVALELAEAKVDSSCDCGRSGQEQEGSAAHHGQHVVLTRPQGCLQDLLQLVEALEAVLVNRMTHELGLGLENVSRRSCVAAS